MIGDYFSCIVRHRKIFPDNAYPVLSETTILYLRYMCMEKGTPLLHYNDHTQVIWKEGTHKGSLVVCAGTWRAVSTVELFRASMQLLHKNNDVTKGQYYVLECQDCIYYHSNKRESMCDIHLYDA